jgi:hypothetical protein
MPSEPNWSKQISSNSVCTWFFALACLNGILAVAALVGVIVLVFAKKGQAVTLVPSVIAAFLGFVNAWALFLVCNRSIGRS